MRIVLNVVGVLAVLMGAVWFLQGANVLTAGSSPMIGDSRWMYYGGVAILLGVVLLLRARRRSRGGR